MTSAELTPLLRQSSRGVTLPCKVQVRSSRTAFGEIYGDAVKIHLTSPPVDGKANEELCRFLAKSAGVPKTSVSVMTGETSRNKTILFSGAVLSEIAEALCRK